MTAEVQPMPSARIEPGRYEVLGTGRGCVVRRVGRGRDVRWWLLVDGELYAVRATKRACLQLCQEDPTL